VPEFVDLFLRGIQAERGHPRFVTGSHEAVHARAYVMLAVDNIEPDELGQNDVAENVVLPKHAYNCSRRRQHKGHGS
jgi:hypothetical protein